MARALITGITGQDGSYLAEHLLARGYDVYGLLRRTSQPNVGLIEHLLDDIQLIDGDVLDLSSLIRAIEVAQPDEIYHLAAQSFVGRSWREPLHTAEVTGMGALRVFEAVRIAAPRARVYQASTSEMFGAAGDGPVGPRGPFYPRSPYGTAKLFAHTSAINYRESYGLFIACGILFNHESPRRGEEFVTRKVCRAAARASLGDQTTLRLGNLEARRDWGWAPDYVDAMHRMLQTAEPHDVVIATGRSHSVRELCDAAYAAVGLDWRDHVLSDPGLFRPADVATLVGDPSDARRLLGWRPMVSFEDMIRRMVVAERDALREDYSVRSSILPSPSVSRPILTTSPFASNRSQ